MLNQDGEKRTIVVKQGDTIRPLFGRSQGHKDLNNEVRNLMNMALAHAGAPKDELVEAIEDYHDDLAGKYVKKDLLTEIAPGLGINANASL